MNKILEKFARDWLKTNTGKLPEANQMKFKRMYSHKDLDKPIDQVIDDMDIDALDWAMTQVDNTR